MGISLDLGSGPAFEVDAGQDLAKHLSAGVNTMARFDASHVLDGRVADVPRESARLSFTFSTAPQWKIDHAVGLTLSVAPAAECTLSILKPGDALFQYTSGADLHPTPVTVGAECCYVSISLMCSLGIDGGAQYSCGSFGISGSISTNDQFRVVYHRRVQPTDLLRNCIKAAFSSFVLPFHAESVVSMGDGDCIDFEFIGKLALGFGATYGFSSVHFGARSSGEARAAFHTPIGTARWSADPCYQVAAGFKLNYTHEDGFRVVVRRGAGPDYNGVTLYVLRRENTSHSASESFGITLNPGLKFQTDADTVKAEIAQVSRKYLGGTMAPLADRLTTAADSLASDINASVNQLLEKADGKKIGLELVQTRARQDTALFIYHLDFTQSGRDAYACAMRGDYVTAMTFPGVELDTGSLIERTYMASAGINLQLFDFAQFQDLTQYIEKNEVRYIGSRTFQIRSTEGIQAISGHGNRTQEADLYFIAECRNAVGSTAVSDVKTALQVIFVDHGDPHALGHTLGLLQSLSLGEAAGALRTRTEQHPSVTARLTFNADASLFDALQSDQYRNGRPPVELHQHDKVNYEGFVAAFAKVIGPIDAVTRIFIDSFGRYADWLAFNRIKNDGPESNRPGDRQAVGNSAVTLWPSPYPPEDNALRCLVQAHLYAAQHFMNFCEGLHSLATGLSRVTRQQRYEDMLRAIRGMIRNEIPFPTYFLKPALVALVTVVGGRAVLKGPLPLAGDREFALTFEVIRPASV